MTQYAATFYVGGGQYTPNRLRADGKGYEPNYISAESFDEAVILAKQMYLDTPFNPFGSVEIPTHILLITHDGAAIQARTYIYDTLELNV